MIASCQPIPFGFSASGFCIDTLQQNISIVHFLILYISNCCNTYLSYLDFILQVLKWLELNMCRQSNMMWCVVLQGIFC